MNNKKVYISMPITGYDIVERRDAFCTIADILSEDGYEPVDPLALVTDENKTHEEYMREDLKLLLDCDYIVRPYNIYKSEGCKMEAEVAKACGIPLLGFVTDRTTVEYLRLG